MTNNEAIKIIEKFVDEYKNKDNVDLLSALELAIVSLETILLEDNDYGYSYIDIENPFKGMRNW